MAAACGDDNNNPSPDSGPQDPEPQLLDSHEPVRSGTRLKLRWHDVGGQRALVDVFDKERNTTCSALRLADDNLYCAPPRVTTNAFKDPGCTVPIHSVHAALSDPCAPPPAYIHWTTAAATCAGSSTVHGLYRALPVTATEHYVLTTDGRCSRRSSASYTLYELGDEVLPSELVKISAATEEVGNGRLRFIYRSFEDGAKILFNTRDSQFDGNCVFVPNDNAQVAQCIANFIAPFNYADSSCTQLAAGVRDGCPVAGYIASVKKNCASTAHMFVRGAATNIEKLFSYDSYDKVCSEAPRPPGYTYYVPGAEVPMARLQRSTASFSARVQAVQYVDSEVRLRNSPTSARFYDHELKTDCGVVELADGSLRCIPISNSFYPSNSYYSDAACQQALSLAIGYQEFCEAPLVPLAIGDHDFSTCPHGRKVNRVGERYTGPLYRQGSEGCERETAAFDAYLLGDVIPLDQLATATLVTDP